MRDKYLNSTGRYRLLTFVLALLAMFLYYKASSQCDNLLDFLEEFAVCQDNCQCDYNDDDQVDTFDLLSFLSDYVAAPEEPLDIVPRWNNFYNESGAGNDGFALFPTIENSDLTWDDIKDDCQVTWLIDGEVFYTGYDMAFNQVDLSVMCSGAFPCTIRIEYQGFIYERTEATWVQIFFSPVDSCEFGLTLFDADQVSGLLAWGPAEPFEFCTNCD